MHPSPASLPTVFLTGNIFILQFLLIMFDKLNRTFSSFKNIKLFWTQFQVTYCDFYSEHSINIRI